MLVWVFFVLVDDFFSFLSENPHAKRYANVGSVLAQFRSYSTGFIPKVVVAFNGDLFDYLPAHGFGYRSCPVISPVAKSDKQDRDPSP